MGKPRTVSEEGNQVSLPVLGGFDLKWQSCSGVAERLQGEESAASYAAWVHPRSPLQVKRAATVSTRFVYSSPKPDYLKRTLDLEATSACKEDSGPRSTFQVLAGSQTKRAVNVTLENDGRDAQVVATTLRKQEEVHVPPVRKQPCPPSTSRDKDHMLAFRRRKFRGYCHGSQTSEENSRSSRNNTTSKRGGCTENPTPETISVNISDTAELKWPTQGECDDQIKEEDSEGDKKGNEENSNINMNFSEVSKRIITSSKRLKNRKQEKSFVELDSQKMSRHVTSLT